MCQNYSTLSQIEAIIFHVFLFVVLLIKLKIWTMTFELGEENADFK